MRVTPGIYIFPLGARLKLKHESHFPELPRSGWTNFGVTDVSTGTLKNSIYLAHLLQFCHPIYVDFDHNTHVYTVWNPTVIYQ